MISQAKWAQLEACDDFQKLKAQCIVIGGAELKVTDLLPEDARVVTIPEARLVHARPDATAAEIAMAIYRDAEIWFRGIPTEHRRACEHLAELLLSGWSPRELESDSEKVAELRQ